MDTISHLALGVLVARTCMGRKPQPSSRWFLLYGAIASELPDLDVLLTPFCSRLDALLAHRAFSHSLLLWLLAPPLLAWIIQLLHRRANFAWGRLALVLWAAWGSHLLVDLFNTYGTAYLYPFADTRFSIDALPILDLTLLLSLSALALMLVSGRSPQRVQLLLAWGGVALTVIYLVGAVGSKVLIERRLKAHPDYAGHQLYTSPLPITVARWMFVVDAHERFLVGRIGPLGQPTLVAELPKRHPLLSGYAESTEVQAVRRFTKGWLCVQPHPNGGLWLHDLRFASMASTYPDAYVLSFRVMRTQNGVCITPSRIRRHIGPWF